MTAGARMQPREVVLMPLLEYAYSSHGARTAADRATGKASVVKI
jgi:hypothetical protein